MPLETKVIQCWDNIVVKYLECHSMIQEKHLQNFLISTVSKGYVSVIIISTTSNLLLDSNIRQLWFIIIQVSCGLDASGQILFRFDRRRHYGVIRGRTIIERLCWFLKLQNCRTFFNDTSCGCHYTLQLLYLFLAVSHFYK